jgi:MFS family permease
MFCVYGLLVGSISFHLVALLTDLGYPSSLAALLLSLYFVIGLLVKPVLGVLADRFGVRIMVALGLLAGAIGLGGVAIHVGSVLTIISISLVAASGASSLVLMPLLQIEVFGARNIGKLSGLITGIFQLVTAVGPVIAGATFDTYGNYLPFFVPLAVAVGALSAAPFLCVSFNRLQGDQGAFSC